MDKVYKRPESVLVVVSTAQQLVLCLKRSGPLQFWQSVTGSLLPKEPPQEAAIRELAEETGLQLQQGKLLDCQHSTRYAIYPEFLPRYEKGVLHNLEHSFCFIVDKPIDIQLSPEHIEFCWMPKAEAMDIMLSPSNKWTIEQFI